MTPKQRNDLLGIPKSTFSDWKKPENPRHNLYLIVNEMKYDETVKLLKKLTIKEENKKKVE